MHHPQLLPLEIIIRHDNISVYNEEMRNVLMYDTIKDCNLSCYALKLSPECDTTVRDKFPFGTIKFMLILNTAYCVRGEKGNTFCISIRKGFIKQVHVFMIISSFFPCPCLLWFSFLKCHWFSLSTLSSVYSVRSFSRGPVTAACAIMRKCHSLCGPELDDI